jgi:hypothetical protein
LCSHRFEGSSFQEATNGTSALVTAFIQAR